MICILMRYLFYLQRKVFIFCDVNAQSSTIFTVELEGKASFILYTSRFQMNFNFKLCKITKNSF